VCVCVCVRAQGELRVAASADVTHGFVGKWDGLPNMR
jgi:hypothetical protein